MAMGRFFLLNDLPGIVTQLERHVILTISMGNLMDAAQVTGDVMSTGADWILQRIHKDRESQLLFHKVNTCRTRVKEAVASIEEPSKAGRGEFGKEES